MLSLVKCLKEIILTHIELKISTCVRDSLFQYIRNISLSANQILYHYFTVSVFKHLSDTYEIGIFYTV